MPNGDFEPMYSTNNIWYDTYTAQCLTNHLEDMGADIDTLQTGKANVNHTHNERWQTCRRFCDCGISRYASNPCWKY